MVKRIIAFVLILLVCVPIVVPILVIVTSAPKPDCHQVNAYITHYGDPEKEILEVVVSGKYASIYHAE